MKQRKIYYRKKGKSIIIEGKRKKQSVYILTLPKPEKLIDALFRRLAVDTKGTLSILKDASLFTEEKYNKIMEKIKRLDYKDKGVKKNA